MSSGQENESPPASSEDSPPRVPPINPSSSGNPLAEAIDSGNRPPAGTGRKSRPPSGSQSSVPARTNTVDGESSLSSQTHGLQPIPPQFTRSQSWKADSATTVARLVYRLLDICDLIIVPIEVLSESGADKEPVISRKLRHEAVKDFLEKICLRPKNMALNSRAAAVEEKSGSNHKIPCHHLIIPTSNPSETLKIREQIASAKQRKSIKLDVQKHVKAPKARNGEVTKIPISCTIGHEFTLRADTTIANEQVLYRQNLDILIRTLASPRDNVLEHVRGEEQLDRFLGASTHSAYGTNSEFGMDVPVVGNDRLGRSLDSMESIGVYRQFKPKLEYKLPGLELHLHLEFQLVPLIKPCPLSELLLQFFGTNVLAGGLRSELPRIRHMLRGLSVYRIDPSRTTHTVTTAGNYVETDNSIGPKPKDESSTRRYIVDVRLPGNVEPFNAKDSQGISKTFTVAKYFHQVKFHGERRLDYEGLPLANIGKCKPGREEWMPLELLKPCHPQALNRSGHLNSVIQDLVDRDHFPDKAAEEMKYEGKRFIEAVCKANVFKKTDPISCETPLISQPPPRTKQPSHTSEPSEVMTQVKSKKSYDHITIVYVATSRPSSIAKISDFLEDLARRLKENDIVTFSEVTTEVVHSDQDLSVYKARQAGPGRRKAGVLFGVVEERGRSNAEIKKIYSELYEYGNRRLGAITVPVRARSLEAVIENHADEPDYIPLNVLRKINFMLGNINFQSPSFEDISKGDGLSKVMVVGAHLSHPGSDAAKYCPSVAAVVASVDNHAVQFLGSARLQATSQDIEEGEQKYPVELRILNLRAMMEERFKAWKTRHTDPPTGIVFYRDGLAPIAKGKESIVSEECTEIVNAYKNIFGRHSVPINYAIVCKNRRPPPTFNSTDEKFFVEDPNDQHAKVHYELIKNDLGSSRTAMGSFTAGLNKRFQLAPNVTCTIPTYYASKLCGRVYDYFYYYATDRQLSNIPGVVKRTSHNSAAENERTMVEYIEKYLFRTTGDPAASQEPPHKNGPGPWNRVLDDTMFYL